MLAILDYGIGNVRSVLNAFEHLGVPAALTRDPAAIRAAKGLILPGVGAFGEGMRRIDEHGLRPLLQGAVDEGRPVLGICLGFQMLMRSSTELADGQPEGRHGGLGLLPLEVVRLPVQARLPHIGWAELRTPPASPGPSRLMRGLEGERFYFVHSYGVVEPGRDCLHADTVYGGCQLMGLVEQGNVFGTQFHPEKSGEAGLELLRNFAGLLA